MRTDLLMIRFASLNQILDPWVYILLRREVVWSAANTIKKVFSRQSEKDEVLENKLTRRKDSSALMNDGNYSCCAFCWHCVCDPPQRSRPASSFYSEYGRGSVHSSRNGSPTNRLAMGVISNVMITNSVECGKPGIDSEKRSKVIKELKHQASIDADLVSEQPKSILVKLNSSNSIFRNENVCSCLLESENDEQHSDADNG